MHLHQAPHQRQPDAQTALRSLHALVDLREQLEDRAAASSAGMPMPVSRTRISTSSAARARLQTRCCRPPRCTWRRCSSRLPTTCVETHRVAVHARSARSGSSTVEHRARASDRAARTVSTARATTRAPRAVAASQLDLAARDARHVEQVVHQPDQVRELPLDHIRAPARSAGRWRRSRMSVQRHCGSAPADCAARAPASPGTRPCDGPLP